MLWLCEEAGFTSGVLELIWCNHFKAKDWISGRRDNAASNVLPTTWLEFISFLVNHFKLNVIILHIYHRRTVVLWQHVQVDYSCVQADKSNYQWGDRCLKQCRAASVSHLSSARLHGAASPQAHRRKLWVICSHQCQPCRNRLRKRCIVCDRYWDHEQNVIVP